MDYVWVAAGSAIGGVLRYFFSWVLAVRVGEFFPWGTFFCNVTGSFLIGILAAYSLGDGRYNMPPEARQFLLIGMMGGYTTFSSFSLQTLMLARDGQFLYAGANVLVSVVACLVAVYLGMVLGMAVNR